MTALTLVLLAAAATLITRCVQSIIPEPIVAESASIEKELTEAAKRIGNLLERPRFWSILYRSMLSQAGSLEAPYANNLVWHGHAYASSSSLAGYHEIAVSDDQHRQRSAE